MADSIVVNPLERSCVLWERLFLHCSAQDLGAQTSKGGRRSSNFIVTMSVSAMHLPDDAFPANMFPTSDANSVETGESLPSEMQDFAALATLDFDSPARQENSTLINMSSDIPDFASFDDDDTPVAETSRTLPEPGAVRITGLEGGGEGGDTDTGIFASLPIAASVVESVTTEQDTHEELRQIDNVFQQWGGSEEAPGGKSPRSNPIRIVKNVNAFVRTTLLKQGRGNFPKKSKTGRPSSFSMSDSALYLPDDIISANMSSASHENDVETGESLPSEMQDGTIPANMSCTRDKNDAEVVESMPSEIRVDTIPANTSSASDANGVETGESMASEMQDGTIPANMSSTSDKNDAEIMESMPSEMQDDTIPANTSSASDANDVETGESMASEMQAETFLAFASRENGVESCESMPFEMPDDTISGNIPSMRDNNDVETGESMPSERQADTIQGNIASMGNENGVETGDSIPSELQVDTIRANISSASEMHDVATGESLPSEMQAITITGNKSSMINRNDDAKTGELIPSEMQDATIPATPFSTSFENEAETDHTKPSEMQDDAFPANMSFDERCE